MGEVLALWAAITVLGLAAQPLAAAWLAPLSGAGLARPLGLLLAGVALWLAVSIGLLPFATWSVWLATGGLVVAGALVAWRRRVLFPRPLAIHAGAEITFAVVLAAGLMVTAHMPDVWGTEKPMDMAFLSVLQESRSFPPPDPWMAGEDLNYYYLGHYLIAFVTRLAGIGSTHAYNAGLALIWALGASAAFGLAASAVRGRAALGAGALAAVLAVVGGNAEGLVQVLDHDGELREFNWFAVSQTIDGVIVDFPALHLVVGDLHAHAISVSLILLCGGFALAAAHAISWPRGIAAGLALGILYTLNTWAFPVIAALLLGAGLMSRPPWRTYGAWAAALLGTAVVAYLPFHLGFDPGGAQGIGRVQERRGLGEFAVDLLATHGLALGLALVAVVAHLDRRGRAAAGAAALVALICTVWLDGAALAVALAAPFALVAVSPGAPAVRAGALTGGLGVLCVLAPEVVYVRDAFDGGVNYRFNTFHKLGFLAFVLFGVSAAMLIAPYLRRTLAVPLALLAAAALVWPWAGTYARTAGYERAASLDGLTWLETLWPGDRELIEHLRARAPEGAVVLEAVGPEYSAQAHARISVFSGRPTVLGWAGHELFWGHAEQLGTREADVREIYTTPDAARARELLTRYGVDYVVVSGLERATYPGPGLDKFGELGRLEFREGDARLYRFDP